MMSLQHIAWLILAIFTIVVDVCGLSHPRCEKITAPMCQGLGYNTTHMPNFVGHENQRDAILGLQEFNDLLDHKCSPFLRLFICSVYIPLCSEHVPGAVPACRGLCEEVRKDCLPKLVKTGLIWPSQLNCSRFPEPPDLCMQQPPEDDINLSANEPPQHLPEFKSTDQMFHRCPSNTIPSGDKCLKLCGSNMKYPEENRLILEVWVAVWSILSLIIAIFALLTFIIQPKRFRWPARPILYLTSCGFAISVTHFIRWVAGSFTCSGEATLSKAFDSCVCISVALIMIFYDFAFALWWCTFSYVWYLSASKEWSTEAIEKISARILSIVWTLSVIPIVYALVSNDISMNDFTGFCELFSKVLLVAQLIIVGTGIILAVLTNRALEGVRKALVYAGRSPYKLERLIYRLGIISLGISVPLFISLLCGFFDSLYVELLKTGMKFLSIIVSTFWVFSCKTFRSWNKILKPAFTHKGLRTVPVTNV